MEKGGEFEMTKGKRETSIKTPPKKKNGALRCLLHYRGSSGSAEQATQGVASDNAAPDFPTIWGGAPPVTGRVPSHLTACPDPRSRFRHYDRR